MHGMNAGKWLARQRKPDIWAAPAEGQRERLKAVAVAPLPRHPKRPPSLPNLP